MAVKFVQGNLFGGKLLIGVCPISISIQLADVVNCSIGPDVVEMGTIFRLFKIVSQHVKTCMLGLWTTYQ
ncbi:hypothetical protein NECAME_12847 [Necator americanus]|uniref:Uncharacterized protein n=1 Tax=Necator americanus TaxID=51031 RepID=W2SYJ5_NECAM|nr:hypothetical protein NECAME_12847 [Necator americanus]ETN74623.1 hypothetical protein NECAME_12847 [Necator americanus]